MEGIAWKDVFEFRAQLYAFLGNSLLAPMKLDTCAGLDPSFWEAFPLEAANEQMADALAALQAYAADASRDRESAVRVAATEFTGLFLGPGAPPAPPWESLYREGGSFLFGQPTFDMRKLLRSHGLALAEDARQLEDHIGAELLYLATLSSQFAEAASAPSAEEVVEQRDFITEHPLSFIGKLCSRADEHAPGGYYPSLIRLAWGVLLWDNDLLSEWE